MRLSTLKARLRRANFLRDEDGVIAVETMIVLPLMFWCFLALFSILSTYRSYMLNQTAAYTISDAISRETLPIDGAYLDGVHSMFEYLSHSEGQSSLRVTQVSFDAGSNRYRTDWSQVRGDATPLSSGDVRNWHSKLPVMPDKERLVLVETWSDYEPPFRTGLEKQEITSFTFTRPRYAPRVCWVSCN